MAMRARWPGCSTRFSEAAAAAAASTAPQPDRARRGRRDQHEQHGPAAACRSGARNQPGGSSTDRLSGTTAERGIGGAAARAAAERLVANRRAHSARAAAGDRRRRRRRFGASGAGNQQGAILPGVRITADAVNNTLLIYANQENYRIIEQTLRQLDRPQLQVSIDATIAEITLNDNLNYGVQAP